MLKYISVVLVSLFLTACFSVFNTPPTVGSNGLIGEGGKIATPPTVGSNGLIGEGGRQ